MRLASASYSGPSCATSSGSASSSRRAGRSPRAHGDSALERSGGHLEGSAAAGFGVGREPPGRPVGGELKNALGTERALDLPPVTWIGHRLDAPVGITQLEEVLHPGHRRPGNDQFPAVAATGVRGGAVKVEEVAGNADILAQPDAREPAPRDRGTGTSRSRRLPRHWPRAPLPVLRSLAHRARSTRQMTIAHRSHRARKRSAHSRREGLGEGGGGFSGGAGLGG